jgi:hypothetical protein
MLRGVLVALGALVLMGGSFGAGLAVSPLLTPTVTPRPADDWHHQVLRVDDFRGGQILNTRLQEGWEIERQDADGRGTTYFLRRDKNLPFPRQPATATPQPTTAPAVAATPAEPPNTAIVAPNDAVRSLANGGAVYSGQVRNTDRHWVAADVEVDIRLRAGDGRVVRTDKASIYSGSSVLRPGEELAWEYVLSPSDRRDGYRVETGPVRWTWAPP